MEALAFLLVFALTGLTILGMLGSYVWIAVVAFKTHPGWGVATLCCYPWAALVFGFMNWQRAKRPLLLLLASMVLFFVLAISMVVLEEMGLLKHSPASAPVTAPASPS